MQIFKYFIDLQVVAVNLGENTKIANLTSPVLISYDYEKSRFGKQMSNSTMVIF